MSSTTPTGTTPANGEGVPPSEVTNSRNEQATTPRSSNNSTGTTLEGREELERSEAANLRNEQTTAPMSSTVPPGTAPDVREEIQTSDVANSHNEQTIEPVTNTTPTGATREVREEIQTSDVANPHSKQVTLGPTSTTTSNGTTLRGASNPHNEHTHPVGTMEQLNMGVNNTDGNTNSTPLWQVDIRILPALFLYNLAWNLERAMIDNGLSNDTAQHLGLSRDTKDIRIVYLSFYGSCAVGTTLALFLFLRTRVTVWFIVPVILGILSLSAELPAATKLKAPLVAARAVSALGQGILAVVVPFYLSLFYTNDQLAARYTWHLLSAPLATAIGFRIPIEKWLWAVLLSIVVINASWFWIHYLFPRTATILPWQGPYRIVNQDQWYRHPGEGTTGQSFLAEVFGPAILLSRGRDELRETLISWTLGLQCLVAIVLGGCFASLPLVLEPPYEASRVWLPALFFACGSLLFAVLTVSNPHWLRGLQRFRQRIPVSYVLFGFCFLGMVGYLLLYLISYLPAHRQRLHISGVALASTGVLGACFRFIPWVMNDECYYFFKAVRLAVVSCSGQVRALLAMGVLFPIRDPKSPELLDERYFGVPCVLIFVSGICVLVLRYLFLRKDRGLIPQEGEVQNEYRFRYVV